MTETSAGPTPDEKKTNPSDKVKRNERIGKIFMNNCLNDIHEFDKKISTPEDRLFDMDQETFDAYQAQIKEGNFFDTFSMRKKDSEGNEHEVEIESLFDLITQKEEALEGEENAWARGPAEKLFSIHLKRERISEAAGFLREKHNEKNTSTPGGTIEPPTGRPPEAVAEKEKTIEELRKDLDEKREEYLVIRTEKGRWLKGRGSRGLLKGEITDEKLKELRDEYGDAYIKYYARETKERLAKEIKKAEEAEKPLTPEQIKEKELDILKQEQADEIKLLNDFEIRFAGHSPEKEQNFVRKLLNWAGKHPKTAIFTAAVIGVWVPGIGLPIGIAVSTAAMYGVLEKHLPKSPPEAKYRVSKWDMENDPEKITDNITYLLERSRQLGRTIDRDTEGDQKSLEKIMKYHGILVEERISTLKQNPEMTDQIIQAELLTDIMTILNKTEKKIESKRTRSLAHFGAASVLGIIAPKWLGNFVPNV